jgi:predicted dehydrogenase
MNSPLRIGQIGVGGYGHRHISTLHTLHAGGACELVAIADPFSARHAGLIGGLKAQGVAIYDDAAELFARADIDAVSIATPIPLHVPQTLAALEAGKHVYLEKPPCVTIGEWQQLRAAEQGSGKTVAVGFQRQAGTSLRLLKKMLLEGVIGEVEKVWVRGRWVRNDGYYERSPWAGRWTMNGAPVFDGPATNALSHAVMAALFLAGSTLERPCEVARVRGTLKKARPVESYDAAFIEVESTRGVNVRMIFTHATHVADGVVLRVSGTGGTASVGWDGRVKIEASGQEAWSAMFDDDTQIAAMLDFFHAATGRRPRPATTLEDTLAYLQAVNGALESSRGATPFDPSIVQRHETPHDGHYIVEGLDEQIEEFDRDPSHIPPALEPQPDSWLTPAQLSTAWINPL